MRIAKNLARLRGCVGSPEPSLVAYVIRTIISLADSVTSANGVYVRFCATRPLLHFVFTELAATALDIQYILSFNFWVMAFTAEFVIEHAHKQRQRTRGFHLKSFTILKAKMLKSI